MHLKRIIVLQILFPDITFVLAKFAEVQPDKSEVQSARALQSNESQLLAEFSGFQPEISRYVHSFPVLRHFRIILNDTTKNKRINTELCINRTLLDINMCVNKIKSSAAQR